MLLASWIGVSEIVEHFFLFVLSPNLENSSQSLEKGLLNGEIGVFMCLISHVNLKLNEYQVNMECTFKLKKGKLWNNQSNMPKNQFQTEISNQLKAKVRKMTIWWDEVEKKNVEYRKGNWIEKREKVIYSKRKQTKMLFIVFLFGFFCKGSFPLL